MKKLIFVITMLTGWFATSVIIAKTGVKIYYNDGTVIDINSEKIDYLEFYNQDDDMEPSDVLSGTTWKINSATEDEDFVGATVTFNSNGNVTFSIPDAWSYAKWTYSNDKLKIVLGEGMPDDYMEGSFIINGKNATYNYSWYDVDGKWGGEDKYVMTLTKQ